MADTKPKPPKRTAAEVMSTVKGLFDNMEIKAIHARIKGSLMPLHVMTLDEDLPEHFTRGDFMALRVPTLPTLADAILADTQGFPSTCQASVVAPPFESAAESIANDIERWGSMFRAKCDEGRRVTHDNRWNLLLQPYSVMMLRCEDPVKPWRYSVEIPDPLTCAYPPKSAPFRPKLFGRHYKMLAGEVPETFKGNREYRSGKKLQLSPEGRWGWTAMGDDHDPDGPTQYPVTETIAEVEIYELDDGEYIDTVACGLGRGKDTSEIVSHVRNLTGGVRAVVMSAGHNPRRDEHRYQPMLWAVYQLILNLNELRAMRATRSINVKPDVLVEQTPEQITAAAAAGATAATSMQMESGGPNLINVSGRPTPWNMMSDPDLDKSIEDIRNELAQVVASFSQTANEKVIQESNVNVFLPYAENVRNKQAPMLQQDDWGWAMMTKMALHSIAEYDEPVALHSTGTEVYGDYKKLDSKVTVTLKPEDIDLDRFNVTVTTQSITEAERRALIQDYAYRKSIGVSTHDEVLAAAGYSDTHQQNYELAKDAGLALGYTWNDQQLAMAIAEELRLTAGILIPSYGMPAPPPQDAQPPGGGLTVNPPSIQGGTGGSGVPGTNGFHP